MAEVGAILVSIGGGMFILLALWFFAALLWHGWVEAETAGERAAVAVLTFMLLCLTVGAGLMLLGGAAA